LGLVVHGVSSRGWGVGECFPDDPGVVCPMRSMLVAFIREMIHHTHAMTDRRVDSPRAVVAHENGHGDVVPFKVARAHRAAEVSGGLPQNPCSSVVVLRDGAVGDTA